MESDTATVTIDVEDVNDTPPVFAQTPDTVTLREDVAIGTTVATISAEDPDTVGTLSYAFVLDDQDTTGLVNGAFTINAETGVITLTSALDYETATTHSLKVQASDGEHPPITTTVTVNVTDANDNAPAITIRGAYMGSVDESDAGADTGLTFIVKDADANANATFTTNSFGISHATDATLANKFEIVALRDENNAVKVDADGNTIWALKLKSTASLDYGTDNAHKLAITVNDGAKDSPARNVTVNVEKAIHGTSGNDLLTGTAEGENIHGNAGNDTITGGGGRDIIYGGAGQDKLTGGASDDTFYLNTANALDSDADIVTDFTRNSNGGDRIRLDIDGEGRRISVSSLESLQSIANIRWEVADKTVAGSNSGSDSDEDNTIIYHTRGANTESDDVILMVLEDFSDSLTLEMFNLVITAGDGSFYSGGAGDDIIYGSAGFDWIYGDAGYGYSGEDVIHGGAGNDYIWGDDGVDTLYGNDGNDHIYGGSNGGGPDSGNVIYGGHGDDKISSGNGNDTLYGGEDNDDIYGNWGHDRLDGGDGNDRLDGGRGIDILYGRGGDDVFYSYVGSRHGSGYNIVADFREDGTDRIGLQMSVSADVVRFTTIEELKSIANIRFDNKTNKIISGYRTGENDASVMDTVIYHTRGTSNESDDIIVVVLEDFTDKLTIDMFDINIHASDGDNVIYGNDGNSKIEGGSGDDTIYGGNDKDIIEGGLGSDIIYGGAGDDSLHGGSYGRSTTDPIDGDDILYGDEGNDYLAGDYGDDRLYCGDDNDSLSGGDDDDWLFGGRGIDVINGGSGYDIFYLDIEEIEAGNTNIITDFARGGDWRGFDRIRVDVSGTNKIAIESLTADAMKLDKLKELADIRWATAHINVADTSSDSQRVQNTVIYNTLSTENKNDDIILMILEDFTHELTFEMFEVAIGGTENGDTIRGSNFDDNIYSHAGNDSIHGGDGADRIEGGDGNDNIWGESGNDIIDSGNGIDKIWGGTGDNIFYLNNKAIGVNTNIVGDFSLGDNQIRVRVDEGETQVTTLAQLKSATNIRWEVAQKNVAGYRPTDSGSTDEAGVDNTIIYRIVGKDDSLTTNAETDDIMLMVLEDYITPLTMEMFSLIIGSSWPAQDITAGPGDDIISGGTSSEVNIRGGDGNDIIKNRYAEGSIFGEGGNDIIYSGPVTNFIDGGAGIDIMFGYYGDDIFSLDTSASAGNTDIVMDFRELGDDLLRVDTVSGNEDTFAELGIRVDNNENKIIAGFETGENDASVMDSVIYKVVGTPDNAQNRPLDDANDIMLMVLEDFASLDMSMFDVI